MRIMCVKTGSNLVLVPATEHDRDVINRLYKQGKAVAVDLAKQSDRNLQHHKKYFGGLIGLIKDYWTPQAGLLNNTEIRTADSFCLYLQSKTGLTAEQCQALKDDYLRSLKGHRAERIVPLPASTEEIHDWIKMEAGYFKVIELPDGTIRKEPLSISFTKMSQEDFDLFYRKAFNVCWNFVLSRHFETQEEAENAANMLLSF